MNVLAIAAGPAIHTLLAELITTSVLLTDTTVNTGTGIWNGREAGVAIRAAWFGATVVLFNTVSEPDS